jgi:hypothetical protein
MDEGCGLEWNGPDSELEHNKIGALTFQSATERLHDNLTQMFWPKIFDPSIFRTCKILPQK